jgi:hypothetical protein
LIYREPINSLDLIIKLIFSTFKRYQPILALVKPILVLVVTTITLLNIMFIMSLELLNVL